MFDIALLIGIKHYKKSHMSSLDGPYSDVFNMEKFIIEKNKNAKIIKLLDTEKYILPTKENILNELKKLYTYNKKNIFVYYSGHGSNVKTTNIDEYDKNYDQVMNVMNNEFIRDNELNDILVKNIKKDIKLLVMMDCCHSGDIMDLKYKMINNEFRKIRNINDIENTIILISGCAYTQYTTDAPKGGAFTNSILKILKQNKNITYKELYEELQNKLNYLKKYFGMSQEPQIFSSKIINTDSKFI